MVEKISDCAKKVLGIDSPSKEGNKDMFLCSKCKQLIDGDKFTVITVAQTLNQENNKSSMAVVMHDMGSKFGNDKHMLCKDCYKKVKKYMNSADL